MGGVRFETAGAVAASSPDRADIACFAGFVARRRAARPTPGASPFTPIPPDVRRWLREQGWDAPAPPSRPGPFALDPLRVDALLDVPVPIDGWEVFDRLFAWDRRAYPGGAVGGTYLGAAVRSFFAQGGRRCYVVRVGDPWTYGVPRAERLARLGELLPGWGGSDDASAVERTTWRGVAHLYGLPDVSFLCLPDLADAAAAEPRPSLPVVEPPPPPERFRECSVDVPVRAPDRRVRAVRAPRCDEEGFAAWAAAVRHAGELVRVRRREVQLVAALPVPADELEVPGTGETQYLPREDASLVVRPDSGEEDEERYYAADALLRFLTDGGWLRGAMGDGAPSVASAFVQLAYPWLRTPGSALLPEELEPADGALAGVLARNALIRGSYLSAGGSEAGDVIDVFPTVRRDQLERELRDGSGRSGPPRSLAQRVSLFGPTPGGIRLLSDVTTSRDESWRPASVSRLVAAVVRAARRLGEDAAFEPAGEPLWRSVEESLSRLLAGLLAAGALRGAGEGDAFSVRCGRETMTQADLDAGRVVARVTLQPAAPVEEIVVVLALDEEGAVRLAPTPELAEAA
jgi:uncharacterized protein